MNMFIYYIVGLLIVQTICMIWFYSPIRITLGQIFFNSRITSTEEFETYMLLKSMLFGKLLSCYICFSFWTSLFTGITFFILFFLPVWWVLLCPLTYPSLCFIYKLVTDKLL